MHTGYAVRRGLFTLLGVAGAVALVWCASRVDDRTTAGYWAELGLLAGAGLALVLSQLLGGWTKDGAPRVSPTVFLLGFLPALVVIGWIACAGQPDGNTVGSHVLEWSRDLHANGLVNDLVEFVGPLAAMLGMAFGFTLDTSGRVRVVTAEAPMETAAADLPTAREREEVGAHPPRVVTAETELREGVPAGRTAGGHETAVAGVYPPQVIEVTTPAGPEPERRR
jgi:hypothetical protein